MRAKLGWSASGPVTVYQTDAEGVLMYRTGGYLQISLSAIPTPYPGKQAPPGL